MVRKDLSLKGMLLMTIAAFGLQFGSILQMSNMSAIYKFLGADVNDMAYLWIAAPLIGLIAQPIIGFMSDRTWFKFIPGRRGRRQPYIFYYAIIGFFGIMILPNSTCLLMAFLLLWVMDLSTNGAQEPLRAMIGDMTNEKQMTKTFAYYTIFASLGATLAAIMPWVMQHIIGLSDVSTNGEIPLPIRLTFHIGAFAFLGFTCITIFTTKEYPPEDMDAFLAERAELKKINPFVRFGTATKTMFYEVTHMPRVIQEFWIPQLFIWFGLFCMWVYFSLGIAQNVYGLPPGADVKSNPIFSQELTSGATWCGICFATYQIVSFIYCFFLPSIAKKTGGKAAYGLSLIAGGIGLVCAYFIHDAYALIACMVGVGMAWGGIMTMPYSIIASEISQKELGMYMGLFNITICIPQIICSLLLGIISEDLFHNNAMEIVCLGGITIIIGALLMIRLQLKDNRRARKAAA